MDDLTLDAHNLAALESYDRAAEAGPRDDGWDTPTGYCTDHGAYDPDGDCAGCVAEAWPPAGEPGPDYFDAYTVEEA